MAFSIGSFFATLSMDSSGYARGILSANAMTQVFGQTFAHFLANPLLGGIQIMQRMGAAAIHTGVDLLGAAERVERLSQQTGIAVETLYAMERGLERAGYAAGGAGTALLFMNRVLGEARERGGAAMEVFDRLGLDPHRFRDAQEALGAILDALVRIGDTGERASIIQALFGRSGGQELLSAINGGSDALAAMVRQMTDLGLVTGSEANTQLANLNTTIGITRQAIEGIKQSAVREFLFGLTGEIAISEESVARMARTIREDLEPAMRSLGGASGELLQYLRDLRDTWNELADTMLGRAIGTVREDLVEYIARAQGVRNQRDHYQSLARRGGESPADWDQRVRASRAGQ